MATIAMVDTTIIMIIAVVKFQCWNLKIGIISTLSKVILLLCTLSHS